MRRPSGDRGSAIVEFSLITVLLLMLLFVVLQVAALYYVRSVAGASAADGCAARTPSAVTCPVG